jgi:hypothetical protein
VPKKQPLLEQSEIGGGLFSDTLEGKSLSSSQGIMKTTNDGERGLLMVSDRDVITVIKFKVGLVPFEYVLPSFSFGKKDLWAKKANFKIRKVIGDILGIQKW